MFLSTSEAGSLATSRNDIERRNDQAFNIFICRVIGCTIQLPKTYACTIAGREDLQLEYY